MPDPRTAKDRLVPQFGITVTYSEGLVGQAVPPALADSPAQRDAASFAGPRVGGTTTEYATVFAELCT